MWILFLMMVFFTFVFYKGYGTRKRHAGVRAGGRVITWEAAQARAGEFGGFVWVTDKGFGGELWAIKGDLEKVEFDRDGEPVGGVMVDPVPIWQLAEKWCRENGAKFGRMKSNGVRV